MAGLWLLTAAPEDTRSVIEARRVATQVNKRLHHAALSHTDSAEGKLHLHAAMPAAGAGAGRVGPGGRVPERLLGLA